MLQSPPRPLGTEVIPNGLSQQKRAVKEALTDINEGADILMVKRHWLIGRYQRSFQTLQPAHGAYSVSGEYAMIKAAAKMNLIDEYPTMCETAVSIFRAGADILISYYAKEIAEAINRGHRIMTLSKSKLLFERAKKVIPGG